MMGRLRRCGELSEKNCLNRSALCNDRLRFTFSQAHKAPLREVDVKRSCSAAPSVRPCRCWRAPLAGNSSLSFTPGVPQPQASHSKVVLRPSSWAREPSHEVQIYFRNGSVLQSRKTSRTGLVMSKHAVRGAWWISLRIRFEKRGCS